MIDPDGMAGRKIIDFEGQEHEIEEEELVNVYTASEGEGNRGEEEKKKAQLSAATAAEKKPDLGVGDPLAHVIIFKDQREENDITRFIDDIFAFFNPFRSIEGLVLLAKINPFRKAQAASHLATQAAKGGTAALRKVGSVLESVDDVMANPNLLQGQSYGYVRNMLGNSKNWVNDVMRKSTRADGWVLREMNQAGTDFTGRMIQYHPGTPRHFGGAPYWKVSSGNGTFRIPLNL